jgi:hypothetical protein
MALNRRAAAIKLGILRRLEIGGKSAFDLVSVQRYPAALMAESAKPHATLLPQPTHAYERRSAIRAGVRPSLGEQWPFSFADTPLNGLSSQA